MLDRAWGSAINKAMTDEPRRHGSERTVRSEAACSRPVHAFLAAAHLGGFPTPRRASALLALTVGLIRWSRRPSPTECIADGDVSEIRNPQPRALLGHLSVGSGHMQGGACWANSRSWSFAQPRL
jgi:hypothetical protein